MINISQYLEDNKTPFIIAEVGINHNGDMDLAKKSIKIAYEMGATAVKIQTFKASSLCAETSQYYKLFKNCEFTESQLIELYDFANNNNIPLFSTVFDEWAVDICSSFNPICFKIASGDITHIPLIKYAASKGLPLILSTGASNIREVEEAVEAIKSVDENIEYYLLHCVSNYPSKPNELNLNAIKTLKQKFNVPIGFSDHTIGSEASIAATVLGATLIEKHFTIDNNLDGPDHKLSSSPKDFKSLVKSIKIASETLGTAEKKPVEEASLITQIRRSIFAKCNISAGDIVDENMLTISRPAIGVLPKYYNNIIGKKVLLNINKGDPILWDHFKDKNDND